MSLIPNTVIIIIKREANTTVKTFLLARQIQHCSPRMKHEAVAPYLGLEELGNPGNVWDKVLLLPG
jgi:hypothetical protein